MPSNEHPDMSGNPCDDPVFCDWCNLAMIEENIQYGLEIGDNETRFFCCEECYNNYLNSNGDDE